MGCDIHLFVEHGVDAGPFCALADGAFLLPRDYALFAALAGVRAAASFVPLHSPRGLPADVSQEVSARYFIPVWEDERALAWEVGEHYTPAQAAALVASGASHWLPEGVTTPFLQSTHGYISHPDWHAASWLTARELRLALDHASYPLERASDEFQVLFHYVEAMASRKGPSTRIVFWFDN
ncbi:Hypothetical protein A7982_04626 [Minicystis rosea]|nr:Hypothetical protein A7982_04626 [Minicystis rosea]